LFAKLQKKEKTISDLIVFINFACGMGIKEYSGLESIELTIKA
jgi:hypothetical protein